MKVLIFVVFLIADALLVVGAAWVSIIFFSDPGFVWITLMASLTVTINLFTKTRDSKWYFLFNIIHVAVWILIMILIAGPFFWRVFLGVDG